MSIDIGNIIQSQADLVQAATGTLVEDIDEAVWVKRPNSTWSVVGDDGIPRPIPHSAAFLVECAPLKLLGVSGRLLTYFMEQGRNKLSEGFSVPPVAVEASGEFNLTADELLRGVKVPDWQPPAIASLHELVKEGRYLIEQDAHNATLRCQEHSDMYSFDVLEVSELLRWIDEHEGERHQK